MTHAASWLDTVWRQGPVPGPGRDHDKAGHPTTEIYELPVEVE